MDYGPGIPMEREVLEKRIPLRTELSYINPWHATVGLIFNVKIPKFRTLGQPSSENAELLRMDSFKKNKFGSMLKKNINEGGFDQEKRLSEIMRFGKRRI